MSRILFFLLLFQFQVWGQSMSQCLPAFPYKNGWLGGDNVLSIPLDTNRTLWIFSDSFVGSSEAMDRSASKLIANSVAISHCTNDQWDVQYFWKKGKRNEPLPIFKHTDGKFKYWPTEVFEHNKNLYVVLHTVGPKSKSSKDDLFNFTLIGTTLAVVKNYKTSTPDQWMIDYKEWPDFFDPNEWNGAMTVYDQYLYTFIGRTKQRYSLIRFPLDNLHNPGKAIEYYANHEGWVRGFDKSNSKVLVTGVIGGSVRYHADSKKWIMIYGPDFLSQKILLRSSSALTGAWSDPITIYTTPEQIEGNANYDSSNFCYCGREQQYFYDASRKEILLTYDCNSSEFTKLVTTMSLYTPRVVKINLLEQVPELFK